MTANSQRVAIDRSTFCSAVEDSAALSSNPTSMVGAEKNRGIGNILFLHRQEYAQGIHVVMAVKVLLRSPASAEKNSQSFLSPDHAITLMLEPPPKTFPVLSRMEVH
jgi:hypothetical protein